MEKIKENVTTEYAKVSHFCILGSYILLYDFLIAFPFSLFKTVLGEGVQTVGSDGPGTS